MNTRRHNKNKKKKTKSHKSTPNTTTVTHVSTDEAISILEQTYPAITVLKAVDEEQMANLIRTRQPIDKVMLTPKNPKTTLSIQLMSAVFYCQHEEVQLLLEQGADPNYGLGDSNGNTPLIRAAECYQARCAEEPEKREQLRKQYRLIAWLLHKHGANINLCNQVNMSPLSVAAEIGDLQMVALLIKLGATIDSVDSTNHLTALAIAAAHNRIEIMCLLIEHGACVSAFNANARSPIYLASHKAHIDAVRLLLQKGAKVDEHTSKMNSSTLFLAMSCGNEAVVALLLEAGANPNQTLADGASALLLAVDYDRPAIARLLLKHGAQVNALSGKMNVSALYLATQKNSIETVKMLIEFGADVNLHNKETGTSTLHVALYNGYLEISECLLANGAQINGRRDEDGATPLSLAIIGGKPASVSFALEHGADVNMEVNNNTQSLAYALAKKEYSPEITRILIQHILKISSIETSCLSNVAARLCRAGNTDIVLRLIDELLGNNVSGKAILNLLPTVSSDDKNNAMNSPQVKVIVDIMRKRFMPNVRFIGLENEMASPPPVSDIDMAVDEVVKKISKLSLGLFQPGSKCAKEVPVIKKRMP